MVRADQAKANVDLKISQDEVRSGQNKERSSQDKGGYGTDLAKTRVWEQRLLDEVRLLLLLLLSQQSSGSDLKMKEV